MRLALLLLITVTSPTPRGADVFAASPWGVDVEAVSSATLSAPFLDEVARRDTTQDVLRMPTIPPVAGYVGDVTIVPEDTEEEDDDPQASAPHGAARLLADLLTPLPAGATRPPLRFDASTKAVGWIRRHSALSPPTLAA
jgi:hypothetical protein